MESEDLTKEKLLAHIYNSKIFKEWHYFRYHFEHFRVGVEEPFAESVIKACLACDKKIPGFGKRFIDELASVGGKEKYEPHYEQLLQRLAELHVIKRILEYDWPFPPEFKWEPTVNAGGKNPEITIEGGGDIIGIEVKCPSLISHINKRSVNSVQIPARNLFQIEEIKKICPKGEEFTLPRDNPIKEFLLSAEEKFKPFKKECKKFNSILIIIWDGFVYEPISSLMSPQSGLFTQKSFSQNQEGELNPFENVDGVIIISHLHQIIRATRQEPFIDSCNHTFDYGSKDSYPQKAFIPNPHGNKIPSFALECFQAHPLEELYGAEYNPQDIIFWI